MLLNVIVSVRSDRSDRFTFQYDWSMCIPVMRQMGRCPILALRIFPSVRSFGNLALETFLLERYEVQFNASPLRFSTPHFCNVFFS